MMNYKSLIAVSLWGAASCVMAQVEVVDRPVGGYTEVNAGTAAATQTSTQYGEPLQDTQVYTDPPPLQKQSSAAVQGGSTNAAAEMFYQMQVMQQEVLELRGLVEHQTHQIKQLKQQRLDDYVDLDRRIAQLSGGTVTSPGASSTGKPITGGAVSSNGSVSTSTAVVSSSASEYEHYRKASKLILGDKDYDAGIASMKEHLRLYPNGRYAGNALYWLGEVYLAQTQYSEARSWFERLLNDFPLHAKVPDAKYKLGVVLHNLGDLAQSKALLAEVSQGSGSTANLAASYLKSHF